MKGLICFIVCAFLLASCDTMMRSEGHVFDKETRKPIELVMVVMRGNLSDTSNLHIAYTEPDGHFMVSKITGMQHPFVLHFSKDGYRTQDINFPRETPQDTVWLERVK